MPQMVLVASGSSYRSTSSSPLASASHERHASNDLDSHQNQQHIREASDVMMAPKIADNGGNGTSGGNGILTAIQQAVVLAQCLLIEKSTRSDEFQSKLSLNYITNCVRPLQQELCTKLVKMCKLIH